MLRALFRYISGWFTRSFARAPSSLGIRYFDGDELPASLPPGVLSVAREDKDLWAAGMQCPCGCGRRLEVMLLPGVKPRWDLTADSDGRPTLHPSIWVKDGCRSHFWLRGGHIEWC